MKTAGNNRKTTSNRVALYGLLIALAFVLSYVETLFPVYLGAPGVKLDSLVIAHQPWRGEYVPGPCTHRPSSHESRGYLKCVTARSALG